MIKKKAASRTRLLPQDPNDEPASVLLERIRDEKERLIKEGIHGYYLRFRQTGDSIITSTPYKDNWHEDKGENGGDHPIDDPTLLAPYGINNLEEGFAKEKLTGGRMVLRSKTLRLHFKKF